MGAPAFENYLTSIQALIGTLNSTAETLDGQITSLKDRIENGINVDKAQTKLSMDESELVRNRRKIDSLKTFYVQIKKQWSKPIDRVIGFVRWAPPVGAGRDLCVIELYKDKFKSMAGNVFNLGTLTSYSD